MTKEKDDNIVGTITDDEGNTTEILTRKKAGRPTLFDEELADKLVTFIRENPSKKSASNFVGISNKTLDLWLKKGKDGHPLYKDFAVRFLAARDNTKNKAIKRAESLMMQDQNPAAAIRALQWYYHQFFPDEAEGKKDMKVTLTQELAVKNLSADEAEALHSMVHKLKSGDD